MTKLTIIYVGDPMCSWCYGYAPQISYIKEKYKDQIDFQLVLGGLRPYTEHPMGKEMAEMLKGHWLEVSKRSGQKFSFEFLDNNHDFIYDTEPPCRATVAVRYINPEIEFTFFKRAQELFYAEGKNTNDVQTYLDLCDELDIDKAKFEELYNSDEIKKATWEDFSFAKQLSAEGFPTTMVKVGETYYLLTRGYIEKESLERVIDDRILPMANEVQ